MESNCKFLPLSQEKDSLDNRTKLFFDNLNKQKRQLRKDDFQKWLNICNDYGAPNANFVYSFISKVKEILHLYQYEIKDEKRFKDEIASFIYKLSE